MSTKTKKPAKKEAPAKAVKVAPEAKVERYVSNLKILLSQEEIADRADRAAQKLAERDAKTEELNAAKKHGKAVIDGLEAELRRLSNEVRTRSTYDLVECERVYDYTRNTLREVRLDTGETLTERPLTEGERQRELPMLNGEE
jgi:hypothetical protein